MVRDLRHGRGCARYDLAVAWVRGRFPCGCRCDADFDLERVAEALNQNKERLRRLLLEELESLAA